LELELELRRKTERVAWELEELAREIGAWD